MVTVQQDQAIVNGVTAPLLLEEYQPISSVWTGTDSDLLEVMLRFYPVIDPTPHS